MITHLHRRLGSATVAILLGLSLAACGSDSDKDDRDDDERESSGQSAPDKRDLEDALLSSSDIPDGFEKIDSDDDEDDDDNPFDGTCLEEVGNVKETAGEPDIEVKNEYEQPDDDLGASIEANISYREDDPAEDYRKVVDDLKECTEVDTTDDDGLTYDLTIDTEDLSDSDIDGVEDADVAAKVTMSGAISAQGQSFDVTLTFSVIVIDHHASAVFTSEFGGSDLADEVDSLAETQFQRVLDLL